MLFECCVKRIVVIILTLSLFACGGEKTDEITTNQTEPPANPTSTVVVQPSVDDTNNVPTTHQITDVNLNLAQFVADSTAWQFHNTKLLSHSSHYFDLDGNINAYIFTYFLKNDVEQGQSAVERMDIAEHLIATKQQLAAFTITDADRAKEYQALQTQLRDDERLLKQRDKYVTIVVSADTSEQPVLDRYFGLPRHEFKAELTKLRATAQGQQFDTQADVVFLGPFELYYSTAKSVAGKSTNAKVQNNVVATATSLITVNDASSADVAELRTKSAEKKAAKLATKQSLSSTAGNSKAVATLNPEWASMISVYTLQGGVK
jgi:hypothetical protein